MLSLRSLSFALTLTLLLACAAKGQSASAPIAISGSVSETVFLSIAPTAQPTDSETLVSYVSVNARTILVSIKTSGSHARQISVPLQIRSNASYTLSFSAGGSGTALRWLRVREARATGRFVATDAVEAMNVAAEFDPTTATGRSQRASQGALHFPSPVTLLTGPRISRAGTYDSPHNAVEVMILAEVAPTAGVESQSIEMILTASPNAASSLAALASR